jgi:flagellar biosynthetic protein FliR
MHAELAIAPGALLGFLLVLARVGGALVFVPLPGFRSGPEPARAALALGFTLALSSRWPVVEAVAATPARLAAWVAAEAAVGIAIGVTVAMALEAFSLAAQVLGLQAGYAYASTVDPSTDADSGVLLVFAQLTAMMLFFAMGLDREVLRLFARSLETLPPGSWGFGRGAADAVVRLGAVMFSTGMRLAFPVVALLVLVDVALALAGRINQQLQLLSIAFPAKMLTALIVLSGVAALYPRILAEVFGKAGAVARGLMGL